MSAAHESKSSVQNNETERAMPKSMNALKLLRDYIELHVREEEEKIFPVVEQLGVDLEALGEELAEHKRDGDTSQKRGHGEPQTAKAGARKRSKSKSESAEDDEQFVREHAEG